jgi:hypothetical protein
LDIGVEIVISSAVLTLSAAPQVRCGLRQDAKNTDHENFKNVGLHGSRTSPTGDTGGMLTQGVSGAC